MTEAPITRQEFEDFKKAVAEALKSAKQEIQDLRTKLETAKSTVKSETGWSLW